MNSATFTPAHAERIAEKLRDDLNHELDAIASNEGHVSAWGWSRRAVAEMTETEVSAYLAGVRAGAMNIADWLENAGAIEYERGKDGWSDQYPIRKHGATCSVVDEDIAGAEGECFHRRHPQKHAFAGRLRKFNENLARIRQFRVDLAAVYHAGLLSREKWSLKDASDFACQWAIGPLRELRDWLSKLEHSSKGLDDEQRAAWHRVKAELHASDRAAMRVRNAYTDQLHRESDRAFSRTLERSAA